MKRFVAAMVLVVLLLAVSAKAVTYKCKGPDNTWDEKYCVGSAKPEESEPARSERESREEQNKESNLSQIYSKYCVDLGYAGYPLLTDCVHDQLEGYRFVKQIMESSPDGSPQRKKIDRCMALHYNEATRVFDARSIKLCYTLP